MEEFCLEEYLREKQSNRKSAGGSEAGAEKETQSKPFREICADVYDAFRAEWESGKEQPETLLELQKKAITGYAPETAFFKKKIREHLEKQGLLHSGFPSWYSSLEDAVYHENWGMGPIAEWFGEKYRESSSAKIIGERIYFLERGRMALKPQRISEERRNQLIRAFLMLTPEERLDRDWHEVYLLDGTRITIFRRNMVKQGQDAIIFRRYVVPSYTFEEQAARGTIPMESVPFFEAMAGLGYNVAFTGAVRTAKTTFLSTWQAYERKDLEGVMIETDPEIPMNRLMPEAPIVQLLADGERLAEITRNLLRSDADYFIMAEARDGVALDTALRAASKGTRRMKITFHTREPYDFPYDVASEIVHSKGGEIRFEARRAASAFDYIFHFIQLSDKSKKRLRGIYEISFDRETEKIRIFPICLYEGERDGWKWFCRISQNKREAGLEENRELFEQFEARLRALARSGESAECADGREMPKKQRGD